MVGKPYFTKAQVSGVLDVWLSRGTEQSVAIVAIGEFAAWIERFIVVIPGRAAQVIEQGGEVDPMSALFEVPEPVEVKFFPRQGTCPRKIEIRLRIAPGVEAVNLAISFECIFFSTDGANDLGGAFALFYAEDSEEGCKAAFIESGHVEFVNFRAVEPEVEPVIPGQIAGADGHDAEAKFNPPVAQVARIGPAGAEA